MTPPVPSVPTITPPSSSGDKRHFLSKLNILRRSSNTAERPPSRELRPASRDKEATSPTKAVFSGKAIDDNDVAIEDSPISPAQAEIEGAPGLATALKQNKTRKRTGSLRKTALLGGRRNVTEGAERRHGLDVQQRTDPLLLQQPTLKPTQAEHDEPWSHRQLQQTRASLEDYPDSSIDSTLLPLRREFSYEDAGSITSSENSWSEPAAVSAARLQILTDHRGGHVRAANGSTATTDLGSPLDITSPTSRASFTSTTDDDDSLLSFPLKHPPAPIPPPQNPYFPSLDSPSQTSLSTKSKSKTRRSPLSRTLTLAPAQGPPEPHSYAETETWGWALLLCTWLTFTVGMGSCLDLWSWAWDVGDTPYAPPELEDDPTLPIVGYYPALMVLTGVVAWVWITVAWVGMKYFRHAKIEV